MKAIIALTLSATLVSGCATIGTVNGVPVNGTMSVSSQGVSPFCQTNPAACIIGGAIGLGVLGALLTKQDDPVYDPSK